MIKTFSWAAPTTNVDGSAVTAGEITGYVVSYGAASGVYGTDVAAAADATSVQIDLAPGTYFAAVKAQSAGGDSAYSNEVQVSIALPVPSPPTGFLVA